MKDIFVFFLLGPTCVGKTKLSLKLVDYLPIEIINLDSSMIYKFMDIGTGKPELSIRKKIKHHLVDIREPFESYSVWNFCVDSLNIIFDCWLRNKIPLLVGGTMMYAWYFQNFFKSFFSSNILSFRCLKLAFVNIFLLPFDKDFFYCKIKNRVWEMLDYGFLDEVNFLRFKLNMNFGFNSLKSIGYKDLWIYLDGKISFSYAINSILKSTFNLAENQFKWIKKFSNNSFFLENKDKFVLKKSVEIIKLYI